MRIMLIQVPYQLGQQNIGRGKGPLSYIKHGVTEILLREGHEVTVETVKTAVFTNELQAIVDVNTELANLIKTASTAGHFPMVLSGDCNASLGILTGLEQHSSKIGIVWFDAHADFNTPATSPSGFFDGMPLAIATGRCYPELFAKIGKKNPVLESCALLIGVRDLDMNEKESLKNSDVAVIAAEEFGEKSLTAILVPKLIKLASQVKEVYLHIDIDVLDPKEAPGVDFRCPNGLSLAQLRQALGLIAARLSIKAAAITAYNPDRDVNDKTLQTATCLLSKVAEAAAMSTAIK